MLMRNPSFLVAAVAVVVTTAFAAPASANVHFMLITEVYAGEEGDPSAQYVELEMVAAGQNVTAGHSVTVHDAQDNLVGTFTFAANVNSGDQRHILIGTAA